MNIIERLCGPPWRYRREQLFKAREVPVQSELRQQIGGKLTQVVFLEHIMDDECRKLMGIIPPMRGPQYPLWVSPTDVLEGNMKLKQPAAVSQLRASGHSAIVEFGTDIVRKYQNELRGEVLNAIYEVQKHMKWTCAEDIRRIEDATRLEERKLCEQSKDTLVKKIALDLESLQDKKKKNVTDNLAIQMQKERKEVQELMDDKMKYAFRVKDTEDRKKCRTAIDAALDQQAAEYQRLMDEMRMKIMQSMSNALEELRAEKECFQRQLESDIITDVAETVVIERLRAKNTMEERDSLKPERPGWTGPCPALALEERAQELQETVIESKKLLRHVIQEFHRFAAYVQKERPSQFPAMLTMDGMVAFEKLLERPLDKCKEGKKIGDESISTTAGASEETLSKESGTEQYPSMSGSLSKAQRRESKKSKTSGTSKTEPPRGDSTAARPSKAEGPSSSMQTGTSQDYPWNEMTVEGPGSPPRKSPLSLDDPLRTPTSDDTPKRRELRCFSLTSVERLVLNALQEVETAAQLYGGLIPEDPPYPDPCMRRALDVVAQVVPGVNDGVVAAMKADGAASKLGDLLCTSRGPENVHYPSSESDMEGDEGRTTEVLPPDTKTKKNILLPGTGSPDGGVETLFDSDFEQEAEKLLEDMDAAKMRGTPAVIRREISEPIPDTTKEPDPFCVCTDKPRILIVPEEIPVTNDPVLLKRKVFREMKNPIVCPISDPIPEDYPGGDSLLSSDDHNVLPYLDRHFISKLEGTDYEPDLYVIRGADPQRRDYPQKRYADRPSDSTEEMAEYVRQVGYPFEGQSDIVEPSIRQPHPYDRKWVKSGRYSDVEKIGEAMIPVQPVAYIATTKYYREIATTSMDEPNYVSIGGPGFPDELGRRYNPCTCTDDDRYPSPLKYEKSKSSKWASLSMRPLGMERDSLGSDDAGKPHSFDQGVPGYYNDFRFQSLPRGRSLRYVEQGKGRPPDARAQRLHTYDYRGQPGFPDEVGPGVPPYSTFNKQDSRRSTLDKAPVEGDKPFAVKPIYKKDVKRPSTDISGLGHKYGDRGIVEEKVPPIFVEMKKSSYSSEEEGEEDDGSLRPLNPEDLIAPMYPFDRGDPCNVECDALCAPHDLVEFDLPGGRDGTERPDFYDRGPLHRGMEPWLTSEEYPYGDGHLQQGILPPDKEYGDEEEGEEVECIACAEEMVKVRYPDVPCIPGYTGKEGFPAEALTPCEPSDVCPAHREEKREEPQGKYPEMKAYTPSIASESSTDVVNVPEYDLSDLEEGVHERVRSSQDPQWKGEHWAQPFIVAPSLGTCPAAEWPTRVCPTAYLLPIGVFPKGHAKGETKLTFPHKLSQKKSAVKGSSTSTKASTQSKRGKPSKTKSVEKPVVKPVEKPVEKPGKKPDKDAEDSDSDDSPKAAGLFQRMRPSGYVPSGAGGDSDSPTGGFNSLFSRMRASAMDPDDMGSITQISGGSLRRIEPAYGTDPYVTPSAVPYEPAGTGYSVTPFDSGRRRSTGPGNYVVPGQPGIPPSGFPRDSKSRKTHGSTGGRPSVSRPGTIPCKGASTQPSVCVTGERRKSGLYPGLKRAATAVAAVAAGLPSLALGPHPGVAATLSPKETLRCSRADLCAIDRLMARGAIASPEEYWRLMQRGAIKPSGSKERVGPRVSVATLSEQELLGILDPCGHRLPSKKDTPLASIPETPPPTTDTDINACPAMKRLDRVREKERKTGEQLATALMERLEKERQLRKPKGKKVEGSDSPKSDRSKMAPKAPPNPMSTLEGEANARVLDILHKLARHPSLSKMFVGAGA